jgi:hypothetical protein
LLKTSRIAGKRKRPFNARNNVPATFQKMADLRNRVLAAIAR